MTYGSGHFPSSSIGGNHMDYKWKPVLPLLPEDEKIDVSDIVPLGQSWREFKARLKDSNKNGLKEFNERLVRSLSIETGILERIYELDRGTTEALIQRGFIEDLIQRESTNIEPSMLVDILRDQEAAIYMVQDMIGHARPLTRGALYELHAILTRHQDTVAAVDQFGNRMQIPLIRGAFKDHPNNPKRADGSIHEYCPPEHVVSEIQNLLTWYSSYANKDPLLVAAWLHHRFTQIHAFQDGNGRLARTLVTMVLLKADLLPLVVDRDRRVDYIEALEKADAGDLAPLLRLFSSLEKNAILQALSLDLEAERQSRITLTDAVIQSLVAKFNKRRELQRQELLSVDRVAEELRRVTLQSVRTKLQELLSTAFTYTERPSLFVEEGGPDRNNAHWYKFELTSQNELSKSGKWINLSEAHYFVKANFRYKDVRLVLVVSFHHIGRELTGVMEGTAFAFVETYDEAESNESTEWHERVGKTYIPASVEPFVITWKSQPDVIKPSFENWLDACVAIALKEWGDRV